MAAHSEPPRLEVSLAMETDESWPGPCGEAPEAYAR
jgi:hypothetical protein